MNGKPKIVKIAAYNVEYAKNTTPEAVAAYLNPSKPDVVCFSEAPNGEWTALVGERMGMNHVFVGEIASANHAGEYEDATMRFSGKYKSILSVAPLFDEHELALSGVGWSPASVVFARTNICGSTLLIGSLHIPSGELNPRSSCAANLAVSLSSIKDERVVVTGDYNDTPDSKAMQSLYDAGFENAWLAVDKRLDGEKTCDAKSGFDAGVIDHILYRGKIKATDARILKSKNPQSDHHAISAEFAIVL